MEEPKAGGSEDPKPKKVFTFEDLCEDTARQVIKCLPLMERRAKERVSQLVGRCCKSLWAVQDRIPLLESTGWNYSKYTKSILMCPKIKEYAYPLEMKDFIAQLAEKCPKIEVFHGSTTALVGYLQLLKGENCIKSMKFSTTMKSVPVMRILSEKLIHLKNMNFEAMSRPYNPYDSEALEVSSHAKILGKRLKSIDGGWYEAIYELFQPGIGLEKMDQIQFDETPHRLLQRHPNLKVFNVIINHRSRDMSLAVLNQLQNLEKVTLYIDERYNETELRTFMSVHDHLKSLTLTTDHLTRLDPIIGAITEFRPDLKHLKLKIGNSKSVITEGIMINLHKMHNLRSFSLTGCGSTNVSDWAVILPHVIPILDNNPRLKLVEYGPGKKKGGKNPSFSPHF